MIKHAWSLVFFTVLGQVGAGLYMVHKLVFCCNHFFSCGVQFNPKKLLLFSLIFSFLALFISFTHLGNPKNAIYAVANFRNSWLSREIFFLAAFIGILLIELIFYKRINAVPSLELFISIFGIFVAFAFVFSMIKLYQLETVPGWNSAYTFYNFLNTALLGGILVFVFGGIVKPVTAINYLVLFLLIVQIVFYYPIISSSLRISYLPVLFYALILIFNVITLFGFIPEGRISILNILIILLFIAGILVERFIFYASYKSAGV